MSDCKANQDKLADLLAGALPPAEGAALRSHVAECADCRRELRALERTEELLASLPPMRPSRDLWPGVAAQLEPRLLPWWRRPMLGLQPAYWAASMACALLVLLAIAQGPKRPDLPTEPPTAEAVTAVADAAYLARWSLEADAQAGAADGYSVALALASLPEETEDVAE